MPLDTDDSLRLAEITREMELKLAEYVGSAQSLLSPRMKAFAAFFIIPAFFPDMWRNPQLANRKAAVAQAVIAAIHFVCAKARGSQNVQPLQPIMAKFEEDTQSPYTFCIKSEDFKTETFLDCIVAFQAILLGNHFAASRR